MIGGNDDLHRGRLASLHADVAVPGKLPCGVGHPQTIFSRREPGQLEATVAFGDIEVGVVEEKNPGPHPPVKSAANLDRAKTRSPAKGTFVLLPFRYGRVETVENIVRQNAVHFIVAVREFHRVARADRHCLRHKLKIHLVDLDRLRSGVGGLQLAIMYSDNRLGQVPRLAILDVVPAVPPGPLRVRPIDNRPANAAGRRVPIGVPRTLAAGRRALPARPDSDDQKRLHQDR